MGYEKYYKFMDRLGHVYWYPFKCQEDAERYAYVHGLCFMGS